MYPGERKRPDIEGKLAAQVLTALSNVDFDYGRFALHIHNSREGDWARFADMIAAVSTVMAVGYDYLPREIEAPEWLRFYASIRNLLDSHRLER